MVKHANLLFAALLFGFVGIGLVAATIVLGATTLLIGAVVCLTIAGGCIVTFDAKS